MSSIHKTEVEAHFRTLPWSAASESKARQVAEAVQAVFNAQVTVFFGGDNWYVLTTIDFNNLDSAARERLHTLMELLERFDLTLSDDYQVERFPEMADDGDAGLLERDVLYRYLNTVNVERDIRRLSDKLDRIIGLIGPVDMRPAAN